LISCYVFLKLNPLHGFSVSDDFELYQRLMTDVNGKAIAQVKADRALCS